ncbi:MAG: hypothetical protein K8823_674 [Cenarchaeum symbiont of Oopsacas minuta]|nr:hypothetical protein [Cenarchaeum symbiont of Oopsacas minuta]
MRIRLIMHEQDDPRKCTAARLIRDGNAKRISIAGDTTLLLNPFADRLLLSTDRKRARSITAVDCSWRLVKNVFERQNVGLQRRLPPLFAGNPVNYAKLSKLTTAESISGALYIMGFRKQAEIILGGQKWGHTFFELNASLLEDYAKLDSKENLTQLLKQYGIHDEST